VQGHFDGVDVDYETLAHTTKPRLAVRVRRAYDRFVADLCPALRAHGKQCVVTVMQRADDSTRVIAYTATKTSLMKVELGIPLYGRDFSHHDGVALTSSAARALADGMAGAAYWAATMDAPGTWSAVRRAAG
jgi:spore germination protein YaaH